MTCRGSLWSIRRSYSVNNRVRKIMPTYEYVCHKCGKEFELFQRMSEEPIKICPDQKCKGPVKRLIGVGAGIIFKGPGFYYTDYQRSFPKRRNPRAPLPPRPPRLHRAPHPRRLKSRVPKNRVVNGKAPGFCRKGEAASFLFLACGVKSLARSAALHYLHQRMFDGVCRVRPLK